VSELLKEICTIIAVAAAVSFVSMKCCIYTAIIVYLLLAALGASPVYCVGYVHEVDGENHYHAWVRVGSYDIEPSTLNICHSKAVNYSNPDATFNTTSSFIDGVDMWSPIGMLM
jgi:hypothetical protein